MARHVVAKVGEIPPGGRKVVDLDGHSVGVFHVEGEYYALLNWCPHQGARLCEGRLWSGLESDVPGDYATRTDRAVIACIYHGWEFDLRTGRSVCEPERLRVRAYEVTVEPDHTSDQDGVTLGRPSRTNATARTFPVTVEHGNIVVDLRRTPVSGTVPNGPRNLSEGEIHHTHIPSEGSLQPGGTR
ncbi:MAG: Rieske 2Fe-2S domain-containing protein [Chloroflexi bacterium]|nr:Rieske 2Fe-2S domain-containing protein [Chloroflexota bacterium]